MITQKQIFELSAEDISSFHDAELVSIDMQKLNNSLQLAFNLTDGRICHFYFSNVLAFKANDVILQNIVSRLLISTHYNFSISEANKWLTQGSSFLDGGKFFSDAQIAEYTNKVKKGEATLFVVDPSWGAEISVLTNGNSDIFYS